MELRQGRGRSGGLGPRETIAESYQPASVAVLDDPGVRMLARLRRVKLGRLSPEQQARFTKGLAVFVWGLDALTERPPRSRSVAA